MGPPVIIKPGFGAILATSLGPLLKLLLYPNTALACLPPSQLLHWGLLPGHLQLALKGLPSAPSQPSTCSPKHSQLLSCPH